MLKFDTTSAQVLDKYSTSSEQALGHTQRKKKFWISLKRKNGQLLKERNSISTIKV